MLLRGVLCAYGYRMAFEGYGSSPRGHEDELIRVLCSGVLAGNDSRSSDNS